MVECVRKWIGENCTPKGITMVPKEHRDKVTGGYVVDAPLKSTDGGVCQLCGKTGVKTALNREKKWVCYECAGVK